MKNIYKFLENVFIATLIIFVSMAVIMLAVQCAGLISLNGALMAAVYNFVVPVAGIISSICVCTTIILSYLDHGGTKE